MGSTAKDYHSYLLRLWRVQNDGENWRASLEDVQTGELRGFQDLDELHLYLESLAPAEQNDQIILESQPD